MSIRLPGFICAMRARDYRLLGDEENCRKQARKACRINFLTTIVCLGFLTLNLYFFLMRMEDVKRFMFSHCDMSMFGLGDQAQNQFQPNFGEKSVDGVVIVGYV